MLIIKNLTKLETDEKFLQLAVKKTLENLPKLAKNSKKIGIELILVGEKRMQSLNRIWKKKDKVTDVLSFGSEKKNLKFKFILPPDDAINLGQVFICYPMAARQARQYGASIQEEIARLLVHGILHLAGYDHEKNVWEEKKMISLQEKILEEF